MAWPNNDFNKLVDPAAKDEEIGAIKARIHVAYADQAAGNMFRRGGPIKTPFSIELARFIDVQCPREANRLALAKQFIGEQAVAPVAAAAPPVQAEEKQKWEEEAAGEDTIGLQRQLTLASRGASFRLIYTLSLLGINVRRRTVEASLQRPEGVNHHSDQKNCFVQALTDIAQDHNKADLLPLMTSAFQNAEDCTPAMQNEYRAAVINHAVEFFGHDYKFSEIKDTQLGSDNDVTNLLYPKLTETLGAGFDALNNVERLTLFNKLAKAHTQLQSPPRNSQKVQAYQAVVKAKILPLLEAAVPLDQLQKQLGTPVADVLLEKLNPGGGVFVQNYDEFSLVLEALLKGLRTNSAEYSGPYKRLIDKLTPHNAGSIIPRLKGLNKADGSVHNDVSWDVTIRFVPTISNLIAKKNVSGDDLQVPDFDALVGAGKMYQDANALAEALLTELNGLAAWPGNVAAFNQRFVNIHDAFKQLQAKGHLSAYKKFLNTVYSTVAPPAAPIVNQFVALHNDPLAISHQNLAAVKTVSDFLTQPAGDGAAAEYKPEALIGADKMFANAGEMADALVAELRALTDYPGDNAAKKARFVQIRTACNVFVHSDNNEVQNVAAYQKVMNCVYGVPPVAGVPGAAPGPGILAALQAADVDAADIAKIKTLTDLLLEKKDGKPRYTAKKLAQELFADNTANFLAALKHELTSLADHPGDKQVRFQNISNAYGALLNGLDQADNKPFAKAYKTDFIDFLQDPANVDQLNAITAAVENEAPGAVGGAVAGDLRGGLMSAPIELTPAHIHAADTVSDLINKMANNALTLGQINELLGGVGNQVDKIGDALVQELQTLNQYPGSDVERTTRFNDIMKAANYLITPLHMEAITGNGYTEHNKVMATATDRANRPINAEAITARCDAKISADAAVAQLAALAPAIQAATQAAQIKAAAEAAALAIPAAGGAVLDAAGNLDAIQAVIAACNGSPEGNVLTAAQTVADLLIAANAAALEIPGVGAPDVEPDAAAVLVAIQAEAAQQMRALVVAPAAYEAPAVLADKVADADAVLAVINLATYDAIGGVPGSGIAANAAPDAANAAPDAAVAAAAVAAKNAVDAVKAAADAHATMPCLQSVDPAALDALDAPDDVVLQALQDESKAPDEVDKVLGGAGGDFAALQGHLKKVLGDMIARHDAAGNLLGLDAALPVGGVDVVSNPDNNKRFLAVRAAAARLTDPAYNKDEEHPGFDVQKVFQKFVREHQEALLKAGVNYSNFSDLIPKRRLAPRAAAVVVPVAAAAEESRRREKDFMQHAPPGEVLALLTDRFKKGFEQHGDPAVVAVADQVADVSNAKAFKQFGPRTQRRVVLMMLKDLTEQDTSSAAAVARVGDEQDNVHFQETSRDGVAVPLAVVGVTRQVAMQIFKKHMKDTTVSLDKQLAYIAKSLKVLENSSGSIRASELYLHELANEAEQQARSYGTMDVIWNNENAGEALKEALEGCNVTWNSVEAVKGLAVQTEIATAKAAGAGRLQLRHFAPHAFFSRGADIQAGKAGMIEALKEIQQGLEAEQARLKTANRVDLNRLSQHWDALTGDYTAPPPVPPPTVAQYVMGKLNAITRTHYQSQHAERAEPIIATPYGGAPAIRQNRQRLQRVHHDITSIKHNFFNQLTKWHYVQDEMNHIQGLLDQQATLDRQPVGNGQPKPFLRELVECAKIYAGDQSRVNPSITRQLKKHLVDQLPLIQAQIQTLLAEAAGYRAQMQACKEELERLGTKEEAEKMLEMINQADGRVIELQRLEAQLSAAAGQPNAVLKELEPYLQRYEAAKQAGSVDLQVRGKLEWVDPAVARGFMGGHAALAPVQGRVAQYDTRSIGTDQVEKHVFTVAEHGLTEALTCEIKIAPLQVQQADGKPTITQKPQVSVAEESLPPVDKKHDDVRFEVACATALALVRDELAYLTLKDKKVGATMDIPMSAPSGKPKSAEFLCMVQAVMRHVNETSSLKINCLTRDVDNKKDYSDTKTLTKFDSRLDKLLKDNPDLAASLREINKVMRPFEATHKAVTAPVRRPGPGSAAGG